jgi:hypothetical protein
MVYYKLKGTKMPKKEKPLPRPKSTPFGLKRSFGNEEQDDSSLLADEIAMAASAGKLDEYMKAKLPDNEHARKLVEMMMGMTGMMPPVSGRTDETGENPSPSEENKPGADDDSPSVQPPEDVIEAVRSSDVRGLIDLLKREHEKRSGHAPDEETSGREAKSPAHPPATIEKEIIDELIKISSENGLSLDWVFFRALKRYVEEYRKTGNL